jgi:hypothetical protein
MVYAGVLLEKPVHYHNLVFDAEEGVGRVVTTYDVCSDLINQWRARLL